MKLNITDTNSYQGLPFDKNTLKHIFVWGQFNTITSNNKLLIYKR